MLDLGCGAAQMAPCLARARDADGRALGRYVGVDAADPAWMVPRTAREFAFHGLVGRGSYVHHDLATGLPPSMDDALAGDGPLLITSCWGITYLAHDPLVALLRACDALAATRAAGASMTVNLMSAAAFDRDVLTRRLSEVVPRHVVRAARDRRLTPLREIRLALRALPRMRAFGDEVQRVAKLMPVPEFLATVQEAGLTVSEVDPSALWGQTTSVRIALGGRKTA